MTPEGKVKQSVKRILERERVWYYMPVSFGMGKAGIPDFMCCLEGAMFCIETKANGGKTTKLQELRHKEIRAAGGTVLVVDETSTDLVEALITSRRGKRV